MTRLVRGTRLPRFLVLSAIVALATGAAVFAAGGASPWPMGGQNISDTRSNSSTINPSNVKNLDVKWTFRTQGDVSATPAVVDGAVYFPDWGHVVNTVSDGGFFYKLDAKTGRQIWSHPISEYNGIPQSVARTSPAVDGDTVYIGDQNGGHLIAVDTTTGLARWSTAVGDSPFSIMTQSPVVYQGVVYVGVASSEEGVAAFIPGYVCCTSRGAFTAVDATTGRVIWKTYTVPNIPGYSGGGVWSSTAAIDPDTRTVYITTGNNYSVPDSVKACEQAGGTPSQCLDPDNHIDSIMALNMDTGRIEWATGVQGFDDWNVACIPGLPNYPGGCPQDPGPDFDFGSGPNLFTIGKGIKAKKVVGAGQKSGQYWVLDARTGEILWSSAPGPGSTLGGIEWGTATDGKRIYVDETNYFHIPFDTADGQGPSIDYSSFAALDVQTGAILWQTPDPQGAIALGPTTVANGVVYVGSMSGHMYALDANNGKVLWQFRGEGASNAGPAIVDGTVYWGNGYNHLGIPEGSDSHTFYAFSLNGH